MIKKFEVPKFKTYKRRKSFHSTNNLAMIEDKDGNWVGRSDAEHLADLLQQAYKRIAELETVKLPSLKQSVSGERYVWSDGVFNFKADVIAVLHAAGITTQEDE